VNPTARMPSPSHVPFPRKKFPVGVVNGERQLTYVKVRTGFWTQASWVSHRRDLSDLGEPYLSAVIGARGGALWFWQ